ncbi:MAG: TetR family transcriptional regulator [Micromonosporaceae bacterium]|nr:TetR family transcriptional regulator [Micromonosporaceae bacterium]
MSKIDEKTRAARRAQILAAAATRFARTGYHATTMADVATEAGVSKGTPYLYFPGKETLYVRLYEEWDRGLAKRIEITTSAMRADARTSPRQVLRAVVTAIGAHVAEHSDISRVLTESRALAAYQPIIAAAARGTDAVARQIEDLIKEGVAAGEWPGETDHTLRARIITAAVHGLMAQWHLAPGSFSWAEAADALAS